MIQLSWTLYLETRLNSTFYVNKKKKGKKHDAIFYFVYILPYVNGYFICEETISSSRNEWRRKDITSQKCWIERVYYDHRSALVPITCSMDVLQSLGWTIEYEILSRLFLSRDTLNFNLEPFFFVKRRGCANFMNLTQLFLCLLELGVVPMEHL